MINTTGLDNSNVEEIQQHIKMLEQIIKDRENRFEIQVSNCTYLYLYKIYGDLYYFMAMGDKKIVPIAFPCIVSKWSEPISFITEGGIKYINKKDIFDRDTDCRISFYNRINTSDIFEHLKKMI